MNIDQISLLNEEENYNNNFCFNIFPQPKLLDSEFTKNIFLQKDFQEKNDNFLLETKYNSDYSQIIDTSMTGSIQEISPSQASYNIPFLLNEIYEHRNTEKKNVPIFHTEVSNNEIKFEKGFEDKLLMNRISARKSRLKKKQYIKCLEEETARLKNEILLNKKEGNISDNSYNINLNEEKNEKKKIFASKFILMEKQENQIRIEGQKKNLNIMKQHENLQKTLLKEMLVKQIHCFIPLRYHIFGEKFIKLIPIEEDDEISIIVCKINNNIDKIKNFMKVVPKKRIKLVIKFHEIYKKIKNFVDNYQQVFAESFKY